MDLPLSRPLPQFATSPLAYLSLPSLRLGLGVTLSYFALASLSIYISGQAGNVAALWLPTGLLAGVLYRQPRSFWPVLVLLAGLADLAANLLQSGTLLPALGTATVDTLEAALTAAALRSIPIHQPWFASLRWLALFPGIAAASAVFAATIGAGWLDFLGEARFGETWALWVVADTLGLLIITPLVLSWTEPVLRNHYKPSTWIEFTVLLALVASVAYLQFGQGFIPFLFIIFPFLQLVAYRAGLNGATAAIAVLAVISAWFTLQGNGPIGSMPGLSVVQRIEWMHVYLAVALISTLPIARILVIRELLVSELRAAVTDAENARREAEAATRTQTDFLSAMSHEIRTPLTGVLGMADLLAADLAADNVTGEQKGYVNAIRSSGRHLLSIINDILDFSRIETGNLPLEHIDFSLPQVLEQLRSLVNPQAVERGLALRFEVSEHSPPVVKGDPTRLNQVLLNLVGNAIKFTERGSVTLHVSHKSEADGRERFRFEVRDTGIGIAPDKQAQLFSAFTQADRSTARRFGGSGLGLAISKRLVEAMGGEIGVNSTTGMGSVFWFEVPFQLGDVVNLRDAAQIRFTKAQPRRILVAEDVEINRALLRDVLSRQGHHVTFAENGAEAVALAGKEAFDLILMDVQMPVMDGIEATRRIRKLNGPVRDIPILGLTANVMAQEREKYFSAGMTECLMKPIDWQQLEAAIGRCGRDEQAAGPSDSLVQQEDQKPRLVDRQRLEPFRASMGDEGLASWLRRSIENAERSCDRVATLPRGSEELIREAHSLRGTAGIFGLMHISQIAGAIEDAAQDNGEIEPLVRSLKEAIAATREELGLSQAR